MPEREGGNVALFIDWDNLAISTAADHSGALPDLRRILLPDDWEGYPLRKDYQVQEFYHSIRVPYVGDPPNTGLEVYRTQDQDAP